MKGKKEKNASGETYPKKIVSKGGKGRKNLNVEKEFIGVGGGHTSSETHRDLRKKGKEVKGGFHQKKKSNGKSELARQKSAHSKGVFSAKEERGERTFQKRRPEKNWVVGGRGVRRTLGPVREKLGLGKRGRESEVKKSAGGLN